MGCAHRVCIQSVGPKYDPLPEGLSLYIVIGGVCVPEFLSLGAVERLSPANLVGEPNRGGSQSCMIV